MAIRTTPARWPFALATIDAQQHPCLVLGWERGHAPVPREWWARVVYAVDGRTRETLIPAARIRKVGG